MKDDTPISAAPDPKHRLRAALVYPALVIPLAASFFYFVLFPGTAFGNSFYSGVKVFLLLWPLIAVGFLLKEPLKNPYLEKQHLKSVVPGTIFGLLVVGLLMFLLKATPLSFLTVDHGPNISQRIADLGVAEHFLFFALFISFAHAALEEFFWRWFAFGQLRLLLPRVWMAHLVAAIGFASHHVVILSQFFPIGWAFFLGFCVATGGAVWSILYHRYGSLLGAWTSHMIVDLGLMWVGWEVLMAHG